MKNSPADPPRFVCRLVRGCVSIFGDTSTGEPRGPGASHIAACEDCQQFFGACDELAVALKRDAAREWRDAPAGLEQNILRAVNAAAREAAPQPRRSRGVWMSFAAVGACAALAMVVYQTRLQLSSAADPATAAAAELIAAVPGDLFEQIRPQAEALLRQDPLQKEVDAVVSDARKAVSFLERNFLPPPADRPASGE